MLKSFWNRGSVGNARTPSAPVTVAKADLSRLLPRSLFDDVAYLRRNQDVAAAVERGVTTAYSHYVEYGYAEETRGQRPRTLPKQSQAINNSSLDDEDVFGRLLNLELEKRALLDAWDRHLPTLGDIDFTMLSEEVDDAVVPRLDRIDCDETGLTKDQLGWRRDGFLILENFLPEEMIERYTAIRARNPSPGGWSCPVPYMHIPELRDLSLYPPLMEKLHELIGEDMGLHLNLTGWVTTSRNWHQDDYLNPHFVNSWYAAVWMALDDIHPDCGPFEFIPGSHRWPLLKSHKVRMYLSPDERNQEGWPTLAERFVNNVADTEIAQRGTPPRQFLGKKGDVLIWHGRLMHRGSYANVPMMQRKSLISHYSGIHHRIDMPRIMRDANGKAYFFHDRPLDFDPYDDSAAT